MTFDPATRTTASTGAAAAVSVCLSGVARVVLGDAQRSLESKDALLLAWLAIEGPTARARLGALLFPGSDEAGARNNLRQRLFQLKKKLGVDVVSGDAVIEIDRGVSVEADGDGELLAGVDADDLEELGEWLSAQRSRRLSRRTEWLAAAAEQAAAEGELAAALEHATALVQLQPESEHAHRRLMRLHYLRGDRAAALAAFDRCVDALQRAFDVVPGAETLALRATIETSVTLRPGVSRVAPASVLRPPRLIGRDAEWQALLDAWQPQRVALVAGEPGMGKTRLVTDLARRAADAAIVVTARPGDDAVPYACLTRLVRALVRRLNGTLPAAVARELARLLPELGDAPPASTDADRARFLSALEAVLTQGAAGGVGGIVFDDLQYADEASVEALRRLMGGDADLAWVLAYRTTELPPCAQAMVDEAALTQRAQRIELQPLTLVDVAALIDSLGIEGLDGSRLAPQLLRHTGGNPLYLLETVKAMLTQGTAVPSSPGTPGTPAPRTMLPTTLSVSQLIGQRITRLSSDAVKLARCAAVAGQDFSSALATHVLGVRPLDLADAWAELDSAQVLRDAAFAHDLIYEAALASVPPPLARHLHAQIAEFLAAHGGAPERIAAHCMAGDQPLRAVPFLLDAGRRAASALRSREARETFVRAADLLEAHDQPSAAFDAIDTWFDLVLPGWSDENMALLDRMDALSTTDEQRAQTGHRRADLLARSGNFAGGGKAALATLAAIDSERLPALAASLMNFAAGGDLAAGDTQAAVARMYRAAELAQRCGDDAVERQTITSLGAVLDFAGRHVEAHLHHRRAFDLSVKCNVPIEIIASAANIVANRLEVGQLAAAREMIEVCQRAAAANDIDLAEVSPSLRVLHASVMSNQGEFTQAIRLFEDGLAGVSERMPQWASAVHNAMTVMWIRLGQWARAQQASRAALSCGDGALPMYRARTLLLAGEIAAELRREPPLPAIVQAAAVLGDSNPRVAHQLLLARAGGRPRRRLCTGAARARRGARAAGAQLHARSRSALRADRHAGGTRRLGGGARARRA